MSARRGRLSVVFVIAAVLALATWRYHAPWWAWLIYGLLIGWLLTLAGRDGESRQR